MSIIKKNFVSILFLFIFYFCKAENIKNSITDNRPNILLAISDDQSWCHASAYGDKTVDTENFDKIAKNGLLFNYAFSAAPSSTPSRASILTGQNIWRLEEGSQLFGCLPSKFETYVELLEKNGYFVGYMKKGWGPGDYKKGDRSYNPAGKSFDSFEDFLKSVPDGKPWCFWYGSFDPHRGYEKYSGVKSGINLDNIIIPDFLPNDTVISSDIADYYYEIKRYDKELGDILNLLERKDIFNKTLIVATSDNGMPFPRSKATLYDFGVRIPLAICWGDRIVKDRKIDDFVSLIDLAPTFLDVAKVNIPKKMTGKSLLNIIMSKDSGFIEKDRFFVTSGRERHAWCRKNGIGYGSRMIRTHHYLYIYNYDDDRWPAGDPDIVTNEGHFGDVDASPSKLFILNNRKNSGMYKFYKLSFLKRPKEELYDCINDPYQIINLADNKNYTHIKKELSNLLFKYLRKTNDPRESNKKILWDKYPYYGRNNWQKRPFEEL
ncbi:MAG: sulfatase [Parabacteroides sp.]|nr:sulfatase [Parabacteroides sp.]